MADTKGAEGRVALIPHSPRAAVVPQCAGKIPARMNISREAALEMRESAAQRIAMQRIVQRLIAVDINFDMILKGSSRSGQNSLGASAEFDTRCPAAAPLSRRKVDPDSSSRPPSSSPRNAASARLLAAQAVKKRRSASRKKHNTTLPKVNSKHSTNAKSAQESEPCTESRPRSSSQTSSSSASSAASVKRAEDPSLEPI